jgi:cytoskeletal protein CcmA (bactofilin family)
MTKSGAASCIGSDMSIVGNVECKGTAQIFGRIEGELRASDLLISLVTIGEQPNATADSSWEETHLKQFMKYD